MGDRLNRTHIDAMLTALDRWPRLGWAEPPHVQSHDALAPRYGATQLQVVRDDLLSALHGGSKVRKLDLLFASPTLQQSSHITTVGAIGSGHLVATGAACQLLGKRLTAQLFWEPLSPGVLDNLAATACSAQQLRFHRSRVTLALATPQVLVAQRWRDAVVLPPGGTTPLAMLGHVRAGLQLAAQVASGEVAAPDVLWVSFGSGGTAVGLAAGLALAGLPTTVHAVLAVERVFAPPARVQSLTRGLAKLLAEAGVVLPPLRLRLDASAVGPGYGIPTASSLAQMQLWQDAGVPVEPVYTGKVLAALQTQQATGQRVLFWQTARRPLPQPADPNWQTRLPKALQRRLLPPNPARRRLLIAAGALAMGTAVVRSIGYQTQGLWRGKVLSEREVVILQAAALALLPPASLDDATLQALAVAVDAYLTHLPARVRLEVHALLLAVEQATLVGGHLSRFSQLSATERAVLLAKVAQWGALGADIAGGLRDLVMLGYYQQPAVWPALGYGGPQMPAEDRPLPPALQAQLAPPGQLPPGAARQG